jgi:tRNA(Arg) A34 adenosine deaminase TadA
MNSLNLDRLPAVSRRRFLKSATIAATTTVLAGTEPIEAQTKAAASDLDRERMRGLAAWTALTFDTPEPSVFGAEIFPTKGGPRLIRSMNTSFREHDPSAHAEVRTIRLACESLKSTSLRGYTLYTTCEPCPMCMACALWSGLDRVVFGATIADAAQFTHQITIPAVEVAKRTDMVCVVDGPVERDACYALFTNPKMQAEFARWKAK